MDRARDAEAKRNPTLAIAAYNDALLALPGSVAARLGKANMLYELDKLAEARALLNETIRLAPTDAQAHIVLAAVVQSAGDRPAAVAAYERYLQLAPNGRHAERATAMLKALGR
jgi:tetratricopeptide (TPR) repeat protein